MHFQPPHALEGGKPPAQMLEDRQHGGRARHCAGGQRNKGLGHGHAHGIRRGHYSGFRHRLMLYQHAFKLKGRNPVVGGFEHIIRPADIGQVAILIPIGDIAGAIESLARRQGSAIIGLIAHHQPGRRRVERDADLPFLGRLVIGVDQHNPVARQGLAHGAFLQAHARRIADLRRGFCLAEEVADRQAPSVAHLFDDFGVQRFPRAGHFAKRCADRLHVFLHEHAPDGGRGAECGDSIRGNRFQHAARIEARLIGDEHRRPRIPGREKAGPGMFRPTRRGNVQMHIAWLQAQHEHGGKMPHRIGLVAVQNKLRLGGGA